MKIHKKEDVENLQYVECVHCNNDMMINGLTNEDFANNCSKFVVCPHCMKEIIIERHFVYTSQPF